MIIEWLVQIFCGIAEFVASLLPDGSVPGWVSSWGDSLASVVGMASGLGAWIPLGLMGAVAATIVGCIVAGFLIKVVRIVASFFLAGGGSAG